MSEISLQAALRVSLNPRKPDATDLLRIIARGVEIGQSGKEHRLMRTDMERMARDYCDANGLSYARTDLRVVERAGFLDAGERT